MFVNRGLLSVLHFQIKSSATNKKTRKVQYETDFSNLVKYYREILLLTELGALQSCSC